MELSSIFHTFIEQLEEVFFDCFGMFVLRNFPEKWQIKRHSANVTASNRNSFARFGVFPLREVRSARYNPTSLLELTICSLRDFQSRHRADCFGVVLISTPTVLHSSHLVDTPSKMFGLARSHLISTNFFFIRPNR